MDSNRYSIDKLMALRGSKQQSFFERKLLEEARENQALTGVWRQKQTLRHRRGNPFLSRANMETKNSSSADSEGHVLIKAPASQAVSQLHGQVARQTHVGVDGEKVQRNGHISRQLDGQDPEPELVPTETMPQRPSLPDQKRKGFEQFYEAVRSPTHVRVTAGGRIVPNTFDPAHSSPTGKGSKERLNGDLNGVQPSLGHAFNGAPFLPGHPMLGPVHPAMHPAFALMAQGPGPMAPFGGFPMPQFALSQVPAQPAFAHPASNIKTSNSAEEKTEQDEGVASAGRQVPMAPFGGQWLLPPHPMMPMGMQFPGPPMMPIGFNPMGQPVLYQQPPTPMSASGPRPFMSAAEAESCPPVSSIRPSIITKNQLAGLRSSLKKAEAQLAYNRHQIDEKHMEEYARQLRADIEHFEVKLKGELALEDNNSFPEKNNFKNTAEPRSGLLSSSSADTRNQSESNRSAPLKTADEPKTNKSRKKEKVRLAVDTVKASASFIDHETFAANSPGQYPILPSALQQKAVDVDNLRKPSGLPVSAALAPVFQPRSEPRNSSEEEKRIKDTKRHVSASKASAEGKSTSGAPPFSSKRFFGPIPTNIEESNRYLSGIAPPTPAHDMEEFSNFARDNAGLGLPYLIGEVPFGMDPGPDVRDYIYHRGLTQDEEMAKHLFWTNAPEHLRKKFPKFDGKDFYPTSPEKQHRAKGHVTSHLPTGRPEHDFGFSLPTADLDPFAPLEPYRGDVTITKSIHERDLKRATKSDNVTSPMKHRNGSKLRSVAYFNSQGPEESKGTSGSSENVAETDSERAYFNSCVRAWSERVTATASALPGAIHLEHVEGYLGPKHPDGHAAASLSPAIVKAAGQPPRLSPSKPNDIDNVETSFGLLAVSADGRAENQPPNRSIRIK